MRGARASVDRDADAAAAALDPVPDKTAQWWLDVELLASWAGTYQLNIAALQGFVAGLPNASATGAIGILALGEHLTG